MLCFIFNHFSYLHYFLKQAKKKTIKIYSQKIIFLLKKKKKIIKHDLEFEEHFLNKLLDFV